MKLLILMIALSSWLTLGLPSNGMIQQDSGKKGDGDILNHSICSHLREKDMCKRSHHIKKKLCKATCGCDDMISQKSCIVLKRFNECSKNLAMRMRYCKWTCGLCSCQLERPLGMQSRDIPDSSITASSIYSSHHPPPQGRLHIRPSRGKSGWCAKRNRAGEWLQVDLGKKTRVQGVATQGRYKDNQWVKSYTLQYSNNGKTFKKYQGGKVFKGNSDWHTVVKHNLNPPIYARYIRVVVKTWYGWVSMRMELYGCKN
ncbi:EGF-like repeat and discoidin I-like domain-containing protein 3 [Exaiptasia diaphana]|uniref:F5/8 type C domain-containing protein n=1 Tax=Exaiptasia diaphana TaxID=2652724 RepID=A0A913WNY2_EXADI|nr:EGF-like repeat and discoidin I-like domain-containing protein 3 [Exaiptasia diaphana]